MNDCNLTIGQRKPVKSPNLFNITRRDLAVMMPVPSWTVLPIAHYHFLNVVIMGAKVKVGRIAAKSVVAGVKYMKSFWNHSIGKLICNAMSGRSRASDFIFSIASRCLTPSPVPTRFIARLNYVHVESVLKARLFFPASFCALRTRKYIGLMAPHSLI